MRSLLNKIKKALALPKPKALGFSSNVALGMRNFLPRPGQDCWEDYYDICKEEYPVRYFLNQSLPRWFRFKWNSLKNLKYEFLYLFHPKHRYHVLSLSQPLGYDRGWIDADTQILYANFNILVSFVEDELGGIDKLRDKINKFIEWEDLFWAKNYQEILDLYLYWKFDRLPYYQWKYHSCPVVSYKQKEEDINEENEMLCRLIEVRKGMWT